MYNPYQNCQNTYLPFTPNNGYNSFAPYGNAMYNNIIRTSSFEGVKNLQLSANQSVPVFLENDNVFYLKTTDGAGLPSYRKFRYTEEFEDGTGNSYDFVSRKEFEELKARVEHGIISVSE